VVQVPCAEGKAIRIGPEPSTVVREGGGEASVGVRIGEPLSRERTVVPGADAVLVSEGHTNGRVNATAARPGVVGDPGLCGWSLCGNRAIS
jgi:hydrogenase maturation factor HypE